VSVEDIETTDAVLRSVFPEEMRERLSHWMSPPHSHGNS
jgi:hypothetical protein